MNRAILLTGGNIGDRKEYLSKAREAIAASCGTIINTSSVYETEAWGKRDQDSFYNQALVLETRLNASELLHCLLRVEQKLGRVREEKYGPRTIDIDIIFFNNDIIHQPHLTIPHPEVQNRRFALQCLVEIVPEYTHPLLRRTIEQLLADCSD
ncbi:MAG: 2-amino-4-hydroxy-6-hydroxymethyldihydropteridine diphosphokinase, partial [Chitinophagaceae bacterium]